MGRWVKFGTKAPKFGGVWYDGINFKKIGSIWYYKTDYRGKGGKF